MKRALAVLGGAGLTALVTYLAISNHLSEERSARLDRALMEAEARVMQLEAEIGAAKARLAELSRTQEKQASEPFASGPAKRAAGHGGLPGAVPGTSSPDVRSIGVASGVPESSLAGTLVRYAAVASPGLTNFVRIEGTSSIHDWQVQGQLIGGSAEFPGDFPPGPGPDFVLGLVQAKVSVFIPVRSLKSIERDGRPYSDKMDEIMYEKLQAETHKRISYTLTSLSFKDSRDGPSSNPRYEATGQLALAGHTNTITMPVNISTGPGGKIHFAGSVKVKMSDYHIEPPNPVFGGGAIKTADEVSLSFGWWANRITTTVEAAR